MRFTDKVAIVTGAPREWAAPPPSASPRRGRRSSSTTSTRRACSRWPARSRRWAAGSRSPPATSPTRRPSTHLVERAEAEFGRRRHPLQLRRRRPRPGPADAVRRAGRGLLGAHDRHEPDEHPAHVPGRAPGHDGAQGRVASSTPGPSPARSAAPTWLCTRPSRAAVIAFTKALALEAAPYGITVNCVCPGPVATPGLTPRVRRPGAGGGREHRPAAPGRDAGGGSERGPVPSLGRSGVHHRTGPVGRRRRHEDLKRRR